MLCSRHWPGSCFTTYDGFFTGLDVDRVDHSTWRNTDLHKRRRKHLAMLIGPEGRKQQ